MAIRAQPVKSVFSRMSRLVRELAASLGKETRLVVTGEETEVDKTVIEELAEPLTHMIRNSMDHGMETPEERIAAGKPREGMIRLSAEQRSGRILIAVADDGRGINRERCSARRSRKGWSPAPRPSDEEIDNLIFLPGFSTAEQVSDVSGRGVGMDVVRRKIQNIGGRVAITSNPGRGARFTLTLPLTLAVLDGMVVKVGNESYILPITSIVDSLKPEPRSSTASPAAARCWPCAATTSGWSTCTACSTCPARSTSRAARWWSSSRPRRAATSASWSTSCSVSSKSSSRASSQLPQGRGHLGRDHPRQRHGRADPRRRPLGPNGGCRRVPPREAGPGRARSGS